MFQSPVEFESSDRTSCRPIPHTMTSLPLDVQQEAAVFTSGYSSTKCHSPFVLWPVLGRPSACLRATVSPYRPRGASLGREPRNARCAIAAQLHDQVYRSSARNTYTEARRSPISAPDSASLTRIIPSRWPVAKFERWITLDFATSHRTTQNRIRRPLSRLFRCGEVRRSAFRLSKLSELCWLHYLYSKPHDW
jgi:hypothetical protein